MDDDLDDLLNEVETKFCVSKAKPQAQAQPQPAPSRTRGGTIDVGSQLPKNKSNESQLTDAIDDILHDDIADNLTRNVEKNMPNSSRVEPHRVGSEKKATKKCFPVFIGGSRSPLGLSTTVNSRACDELRCTDCDFKVSAFDDYQWHSSVNYLFLRNNMPDYHRLKGKLMKTKGSRAYACQCKWKTTSGELHNLQTETDVKWVCGKHS